MRSRTNKNRTPHHLHVGYQVPIPPRVPSPAAAQAAQAAAQAGCAGGGGAAVAAQAECRLRCLGPGEILRGQLRFS